MTRLVLLVAFEFALALALSVQPAAAQKPQEGKPAFIGSPDDGFPACWDGCPQDPTHDGLINIDDLVQVIVHWGDFGGYTDINHDGVTNIDDLVILITSWGVCPPPANNSCAAPATINLNGADFHFCTRYATTDGPAVNACGFCCGDTQIHKDVWYRFNTSVFAANYAVEMGMCGSNFDTKIAVYRFNGVGNCACAPTDAALVACNDDTGTWCNTSSKVQFQLAASSCYLVRVGGYNGQSGDGRLYLKSFKNGDECFNAIDLGTVTASNPLIVAGDTYPASEYTVGYLHPQAGCVGVPDGPDVWYKFHIGCGGNVLGSVYTCDDYTNFDTILEVFQGHCEYEDGGLFYAVANGCNDDYTQWNACLLNGVYRKSLVDLPSAANGNYYYIRLSGYNSSFGNYRLHVSLSCVN